MEGSLCIFLGQKVADDHKLAYDYQVAIGQELEAHRRK